MSLLVLILELCSNLLNLSAFPECGPLQLGVGKASRAFVVHFIKVGTQVRGSFVVPQLSAHHTIHLYPSRTHAFVSYPSPYRLCSA
jgi:hypothetical protein